MTDTSNSPRSLPALAAAFAEMTAARTAPDAIRSMTFRVVKRGFDQDDVRAYLDRLAGDVELLHDRIAQLQADIDEAGAGGTLGDGSPMQASAPAVELQLPEPPPETSSRDEIGSSIAELMRTFVENVDIAERAARAGAEQLLAAARAEADEVRREARVAREEAVADAASVVASARSDAERMQRDARARADELQGTAERTLSDAQARADEILRSIGLRRDRLDEDIRTLREALAETLERMDGVIRDRRSGRTRDDLVVVEDPVDERTP
jgi:DivIVA domain-containing protein